MSRPPTGRAQLRVAAVAAALLLVTAATVTGATTWGRPDNRDAQVLAMGPGELSLALRDAAQQCLGWAAHDTRPSPEAGDERQVRVVLDDLAVAVKRGNRTVVLFLNDSGYATCDRHTAKDQEPTGGFAVNPWQKGAWLPGPVQRLLLVSTEPNGGEVAISGRTSPRVARLVLDHGDGRETVARLRDGAFGLLTKNARLRPGDTPELVSYDKQGTEIDRRPLFQAEEQLAHCYVTPSGELVYGTRGATWRPAEKWER